MGIGWGLLCIFCLAARYEHARQNQCRSDTTHICSPAFTKARLGGACNTF